jgi:hypothetical protein
MRSVGNLPTPAPSHDLCTLSILASVYSSRQSGQMCCSAKLSNVTLTRACWWSSMSLTWTDWPNILARHRTASRLLTSARWLRDDAECGCRTGSNSIAVHSRSRRVGRRAMSFRCTLASSATQLVNGFTCNQHAHETMAHLHNFYTQAATCTARQFQGHTASHSIAEAACKVAHSQSALQRVHAYGACETHAQGKVLWYGMAQRASHFAVSLSKMTHLQALLTPVQSTK